MGVVTSTSKARLSRTTKPTSRRMAAELSRCVCIFLLTTRGERIDSIKPSSPSRTWSIHEVKNDAAYSAAYEVMFILSQHHARAFDIETKPPVTIPCDRIINSDTGSHARKPTRHYTARAGWARWLSPLEGKRSV